MSGMDAGVLHECPKEDILGHKRAKALTQTLKR